MISKLLAPLSSPLTWIVLLCAASLMFRKKRAGKTLLIATFSSLLFFTNKGVILVLMSSWEIPPVRVERGGCAYKYGVVLGGFAAYNPYDDMIEFNNSSDRINHAIALYRMGTFDTFVLSGGDATLVKAGKTEAQVSYEYLVSIGIPPGDIICEDKSLNTIENVLFIKQILNSTGSDCLLITSAYHMRRSLAIFRKQGLRPAYYCCDMRGSGLRADSFATFGVESLSLWDAYIHELIGFGIYRIMGYC